MKIPLTTVEALKNITIAAPCPTSWDKMRGDEQVRYCEQCKQNVYNLSEMTASEAVELIQHTEGRLCVQFYRRPDGTVITTDCPGGLRWRIWKWLRKRRAWIASLFAILVLPACGGMQHQPDRLIDLKSTAPAPESPGPAIDPNERREPARSEPNKDDKSKPGERNIDRGGE